MAMFTGCQNEEIMEQDSEKDEPVPTGDTRIIIEGEGMLETSARSSDGRVDFTGVYAREGKEALMRCLYLEEGYFRRFLEQTGLEERI